VRQKIPPEGSQKKGVFMGGQDFLQEKTDVKKILPSKKARDPSYPSIMERYLEGGT